MASSSRIIFTLVFIFYLLLLPSTSDGSLFSNFDMQHKRTVVGSRPPGCVNKCSNCRPCEATLVIPPHQRKSVAVAVTVTVTASSDRDQDDPYYPVSWKCRCGDKLYQP